MESGRGNFMRLYPTSRRMMAKETALKICLITELKTAALIQCCILVYGARKTNNNAPIKIVAQKQPRPVITRS